MNELICPVTIVLIEPHMMYFAKMPSLNHFWQYLSLVTIVFVKTYINVQAIAQTFRQCTSFISVSCILENDQRLVIFGKTSVL